MEVETMDDNHLPSFIHRYLHAAAPMLMISMGYIDPGKWAATVEGGARFGFDLMAFMLVFNFAAILCQYISAKIGAITGKDLAEVPYHLICQPSFSFPILVHISETKVISPFEMWVVKGWWAMLKKLDDFIFFFFF